MRREAEFITLLSGAVAAWPLAAAAQSTLQLTQATTAPQIEVVRVKPIDPAAVGSAWKVPPTDETFDARYGRW